MSRPGSRRNRKPSSGSSGVAIHFAFAPISGTGTSIAERSSGSLVLRPMVSATAGVALAAVLYEHARSAAISRAGGPFVAVAPMSTRASEVVTHGQRPTFSFGVLSHAAKTKTPTPSGTAQPSLTHETITANVSS